MSIFRLEFTIITSALYVKKLWNWHILIPSLWIAYEVSKWGIVVKKPLPIDGEKSWCPKASRPCRPDSAHWELQNEYNFIGIGSQEAELALKES